MDTECLAFLYVMYVLVLPVPVHKDNNQEMVNNYSDMKVGVCYHLKACNQLMKTFPPPFADFVCLIARFMTLAAP